uniref:inorganic diphosphatase n=1 Tax=Zooxanthella nutricula TaxID=1333877 RepID=A0A7S2K688_9DINO
MAQAIVAQARTRPAPQSVRPSVCAPGAIMAPRVEILRAAALLCLSLVRGIEADPAAKVAVFGHKAPDTDTVASAIIYAWELQERQVPAQAFRLGDLNPETQYVLQTLGVEAPPLLEGALAVGAQVAIVDTNNPAELPDGVAKAKIHSIVDHHKLAGLVTAEPLEIDVRPWCSATSILFARASASELTPPKHIAGLMLAGILSDSLKFRSPTTTKADIAHAHRLSKLAGVGLDSLADGMFDAKAKVDHYSPKELLMMDSKVFTIGGRKLRVSVLETTKPAAPLGRKEALLAAMRGLVAEEKIDDVLFFVVDILKEEATFLSGSSTARSIVERAWKVKVDTAANSVVLPGVLSRKKQIIPKLEATANDTEL